MTQNFTAQELNPVSSHDKWSDSRQLDPNIMQRAASDPDASVWVNASAGTGKTKVLTDRLIRLMLPRTPLADGQFRDGTPPHRILCLTYTKAGAGEMLNRIMETLSKWSAMSDESLSNCLEHDVLGHPPTPAQKQKARSLFAEVVDTPGGIKIMTIHSFCQSLLGRFPLEAQLPPDFELMGDDDLRDMIRSARDEVMHRILSNTALNLEADDPERFAYQRLQSLLPQLIKAQNSDQLIALLNTLASQRQKIKALQAHHMSLEGLSAQLYILHDLKPFCDFNDIQSSIVRRIEHDDLEALASWFLSSTGKRDIDKGERLVDWLRFNSLHEDDLQSVDLKGLEKILLPYHTTAPIKALKEDNPKLYELYQDICCILKGGQEVFKNYETAWKSEAVLHLGALVLRQYERLKSARHLLDYDDLILKTVQLVQNAPEWVLYKLDGGIDHILVDEAQDSNPDQWTIIKALIREFVSGKGQNEDDIRTLFVVGDEKQSIFGFQGSDPDVFQEMRRGFAVDFKRADLLWRDQPLNISFRSVQAVLDIVDHAFQSAQHVFALTGNAEETIEHKAFRAGQAGHVELWPLLKPQEVEAQAPWTLPNIDDIQNQATPYAALSQKIATTIKGWLNEGRQIAASGQALRAGDIMILVRRRNSFVDHMIRALKEQDIPVSGVDRMVLSTQIAIQDLLAIARFALMQDDDLSLACILKSPFIGMDEDQLQQIAYTRKGTLWAALKQQSEQNDPSLTPVIEWLQHSINNARALGIHDFFSDILQRPCPRVFSDNSSITGLQSLTGRLGSDCLDAIEEFLSRCFDFDLKHRSTIQHFIHHFESDESDIKREIDEGQNVVRIMTVHGSKGLQSPIVFLPDTILTSRDKNNIERILWTPPTNDMMPALPLWNNTTTDASTIYQKFREDAYERQKREYDRLLYVAMTRAEDELYICGCVTSANTEPQDYSWYNVVRDALLSHPEHVKLGDEDAPHIVYKTQQSETADQRKLKPLISIDALESVDRAQILPPSFIAPPDAEPDNPPKPLQPSRPSEEEAEPAALSPLKAAGAERRFKRGNLLHALLQFIPDIPQELRQERSLRFLSLHAPDLTEKELKDLSAEVLNIVENDKYRALFDDQSKAEVPVTGLLHKQGGEVQVVTGQIDRLAIDHNSKIVMIVDYKTNRPAPRDAKDIPRQYIKQMNTYRALLEQIYEGYEVKSFILWTDYSAIMECPYLEV